MKRTLVAILAVFYMASATGTTVHFHFCMGRLVSAGLVHCDDDHFCSRCGMKKSTDKKGCCKDETKQFKSVDQIKTAPAAIIKACSEFALLPAYSVSPYVSLSYVVYHQTTPLAHAPPDLRHNCPIYIEVRNIRI